MQEKKKAVGWSVKCNERLAVLSRKRIAHRGVFVCKFVCGCVQRQAKIRSEMPQNLFRVTANYAPQLGSELLAGRPFPKNSFWREASSSRNAKKEDDQVNTKRQPIPFFALILSPHMLYPRCFEPPVQSDIESTLSE